MANSRNLGGNAPGLCCLNSRWFSLCVLQFAHLSERKGASIHGGVCLQSTLGDVSWVDQEFRIPRLHREFGASLKDTLRLCLKNKRRAREGVVLRGTCCSDRGPGFVSYQPCGVSQLCLTSILGDLIPSSDL